MRSNTTIKIGGLEFGGFWDLSVEFHLDSYASFSFSAPFEPDNAEFRSRFRPFSFTPIELDIDGERKLTGVIIGVDPNTDPDSRTVAVSGYARPGVLHDANMPVSEWPLEYNGLDFAQLADRICSPFGFGVVVEGDIGGAFRRVALDPDGSPQTLLADLAKQRGFILSDTPEGDVRVRKAAVDGVARATLVEGQLPLGNAITVQFDPQKYPTAVTGIGGARAGREGSNHTVQNPHGGGVVRPFVFKPDDTETGDVPAAAEARLGFMLGNLASWSVDLPTWKDPGGSLWEPNTTLLVTAPSAMIYEETRLIVRKVQLDDTADEQTAKLDLALPGAFSGEIPESLPWQ